MNRMQKDRTGKHRQEICFCAYETWCRIWIEERVDGGEILSACRAIALQVEGRLNMYDRFSEISLLCQNYQPGEVQKVSPALFSFLEMNLQMAKLSGGRFDFTVGVLVKRWNFGSGVGDLPDKEEIEQLLACTGYQHVHLAGKDGVVFDLAGMVLDAGGSGKGFALDRVADYLRGKGVRRAWMDFGGNLYVMGDEGRTVGIRNPLHPGGVICQIEAKNQAVSTSACYEHAILRDGKRYGHILNPEKGRPGASGLNSVTVLAPSAAYADMLSTAIYLAGREEGMVLLNKARTVLGGEIRCIMVPGPQAQG